MACPEVCECLGDATRVLHLQPVRGACEDKTLGMRQPLWKQPMRFPKTGPEGVALAVLGSENRLGDAPRLCLAEAPIQPSR